MTDSTESSMVFRVGVRLMAGSQYVHPLQGQPPGFTKWAVMTACPEWDECVTLSPVSLAGVTRSTCVLFEIQCKGISERSSNARNVGWVMCPLFRLDRRLVTGPIARGIWVGAYSPGTFAADDNGIGAVCDIFELYQAFGIEGDDRRELLDEGITSYGDGTLWIGDALVTELHFEIIGVGEIGGEEVTRFGRDDAPIVYPLHPEAIESHVVDLKMRPRVRSLWTGVGEVLSISDDDKAKMDELLQRDVLVYKYTFTEKAFFMDKLPYIYQLCNENHILHVLCATDWNVGERCHAMYDTLTRYRKLRLNGELVVPIELASVLAMLTSLSASDTFVRAYAVERLEEIVSIHRLPLFINQLVQVLKLELYVDNYLIRFLLRACVQSREVCNRVFWAFRSESMTPVMRMRFVTYGCMVLRVCGPYLRNSLMKQASILSDLESIAVHVREMSGTIAEREEFLRTKLGYMLLYDAVQFPLNPLVDISGFDIKACRVMSSKKKPLYLVCKNDDPLGKDLHVIFKNGDDLRQDVAVLDMLRIMEEVFLQDIGSGLEILPYHCVSTSPSSGFIEVVRPATTLSRIQKAHGGALGAFGQGPLYQWLKEKGTDDFDSAVQRFVRSCAGYCVASYVLGLGDRHNDNIMLKENGNLFHIDYGHWLGHKKSKMGVNREPAPFIFTPMMKYVMTEQAASERESEDEFKPVKALVSMQRQPLEDRCLTTSSHATLASMRGGADPHHDNDESGSVVGACCSPLGASRQDNVDHLEKATPSADEALTTILHAARSDGGYYGRFLTYSARAFVTIRLHRQLLMSLFCCMLPARLDELLTTDEVRHVSRVLPADVQKSEGELVELWYDLVNKSLTTKMTLINDFAHNVVH